MFHLKYALRTTFCVPTLRRGVTALISAALLRPTTRSFSVFHLSLSSSGVGLSAPQRFFYFRITVLPFLYWGFSSLPLGGPPLVLSCQLLSLDYMINFTIMSVITIILYLFLLFFNKNIYIIIIIFIFILYYIYFFYYYSLVF